MASHVDDFFPPSWVDAPVGSIVGMLGGYYTNTANGGFKDVLGNSISALNRFLKPYGWRVCDGGAPNDPDSPVFNATNRHVPNITGNRFLRGSTSAGSIGGSTTHHHSMPGHTLSINEIPAHKHLLPVTNSAGTKSMWYADAPHNRQIAQYTDYYGSTRAHVHGNVGTSTKNANVPRHLSVVYIIKVK